MPNRRYADLTGGIVTSVLGVPIVAMTPPVPASSATADAGVDDNDAPNGTAAGVTVFAAVFVVASAFAFTVAPRRREPAPPWAAGAPPHQVRGRMPGEAFVLPISADRPNAWPRDRSER